MSLTNFTPLNVTTLNIIINNELQLLLLIGLIQTNL